MILKFEVVCSVKGLLIGCELHLVWPIVRNILLNLRNALAASSLWTCTGCCGGSLCLSSDALRHGRFGCICTSRINLLPWSSSLEFWTHTNWSCCSLLTCGEIGTLESVCIVSSMWVVIVRIWSSRASSTSIQPLICELDLVLLFLVRGRNLLHHWASSFQFIWVMSHQIRDYWSLWTRNCTTQWWNGSSMQISTALWTLCICCWLRKLPSWRNTVALDACWIQRLFCSVGIDLRLKPWTIIL